MTQLTEDRALAVATLMPRNPTVQYAGLTRSGRAEVDRLVEAFRQVRRRALDEVLTAQRTEHRRTCNDPIPFSWHEPIRCELPVGHDGMHECEDTGWSA